MSVFFCVVDLHAITVKQDSKELRKAATAKVYSIQTDQVFITNESGLVTSIE